MRQAIIERVGRKVFFVPEADITTEVLEAAGFFDLLEAAEEIYNQFGYVLPLPHKHMLKDAISKAKGDAE